MLATLLTPPGRGALAVVHVSGAGARALVRSLFSRDFADHPVPGRLALDGEPLDEVMVRTAEGFTGEETVEITCHGGNGPVARVMRALETRGAKHASERDLLERGVETGHLDRIRAEAWQLLPRALTELAGRMLFAQARGALSRALETGKDAAKLLETSALGLALAIPRRIVIVGRPNAGKSTLFNTLVGSDRVIASPLPGTTRDPVRETAAIGQVPLEFIDTAGVEIPRDPLEALSIERTHRRLQDADAVIFLFDAHAGTSGEELKFFEGLGPRRVVPLLNKIDIGSKRPPLEALPVSAKTGQGLPEVRHAILHALGVNPAYREGAPAVFTPRQERLLRDAVEGRLHPETAREQLLRGPVTP